jgi:hypothetical protein
MFNLEQSIAAWRQQMLAAGIKTPVPLEELEIHLREEIERQTKSGLNGQKAFEISIQQVGQPQVLQAEFEKDHQTIPMKRIVIIGNGIGSILIGVAMIMPAIAQHRHEGAMTSESTVMLIVGILLTLGGGSTAICGFTLRKTHT